MRDLFNVTASEIIGEMADDLVREKGISKALAKKVIVNALCYNCVQSEIFAQAYFILGDEEGEEEEGYDD